MKVLFFFSQSHDQVGDTDKWTLQYSVTRTRQDPRGAQGEGHPAQLGQKTALS